MLLPIGRANEGKQTASVIVYVLIVINVLVFLWELLVGDKFIAAYSVVPWEITHGADLIRPVHLHGIGVIPQAPGPAPIYLTLLTAMFMHSGWLHIGGNMLYLWIFGGEIETAFGHLKFLAFYLGCGFVAFIAQILPDPDSVIPSLGASGAIAGVMGAYLRLFPFNQIRVLLPLGWLMIPIRLPALVVIGFWIVLQAPVIMMSQNRQAIKDRLDAQHDYEVNLKAELEIAHLHEKFDELRERVIEELLVMQKEQTEILRGIRDERQTPPPADR